MSDFEFFSSALRGLLLIEKGTHSKFNKLEITPEEGGVAVSMDGQGSAILLAIFASIESLAYSSDVTVKDILSDLNDVLMAKDYGIEKGEPVSELRENINLKELEEKLDKLFGNGEE